MKKIALLSTVALLATTPAFAGSVLGDTDDAEPFKAAAPIGSGINPALAGVGLAVVVGAIVIAASGGNGSSTTTTQTATQ